MAATFLKPSYHSAGLPFLQYIYAIHNIESFYQPSLKNSPPEVSLYIWVEGEIYWLAYFTSCYLYLVGVEKRAFKLCILPKCSTRLTALIRSQNLPATVVLSWTLLPIILSSYILVSRMPLLDKYPSQLQRVWSQTDDTGSHTTAMASHIELPKIIVYCRQYLFLEHSSSLDKNVMKLNLFSPHLFHVVHLKLVRGNIQPVRS